MKLFSKLSLIVSGMMVMAALAVGTATTFAQEDAPADDGAAPTERAAKEAHPEIAEVLGITVEELQAYYDAGTRHRDIIEDLGLDVDEIKPELRAVKKALKMESRAELLGMTVEELQAELDSGRTIHEIAEEAGVELPDCNGRKGKRGGNTDAVTGDNA